MQMHAWAGLTLGITPWQAILPPYENFFSCLNQSVQDFVWLVLSLP